LIVFDEEITSKLKYDANVKKFITAEDAEGETAGEEKALSMG
jgi:hypothetical protein